MRKFYLFLLLLFSGIVYADGLPDLGDVAQLTLTPQDERRIADEIMRDVYSSNQVIKDVEVIDYLQALGARLAAHSPDTRQKFTFFVVKDSSINAFAMPGGVIGTHSGLILSSESESELASVLGHEIGHVVQRHIARMLAQQKQDAWKSWAAMAFALLAARSNPQLAGASMQAAQAGAIQRQLDYTREHEREADRVGLQILDEAGFDVRAMPAFFDKLLKGTRFYEGGAPSFLRTHPLTTERIADVSNRVDRLPYKQVPDSAEFHYVRAKLRALDGSPQQAVEWFDGVLRGKKYADEASQHYGMAMALVRANRLDQAQQEIAWLRDHVPAHPMIETLDAHLQLALGNGREAGARFRESLAKFPSHRGLIYGYAELLLATRKADETLRFIADKRRNYPEDPYLYELESQAYTLSGDNLNRHQAQGEAYYLRHNVPAAIEQMELALRSGNGDFYQLSIVESKLKRLRQIQEDVKPK